MIPKQQHKKGGGNKGTPRTDRKQSSLSKAKGSAGPAAPKQSQAKRPQGTRIAAPGGRNSRVNTFDGGGMYEDE